MTFDRATSIELLTADGKTVTATVRLWYECPDDEDLIRLELQVGDRTYVEDGSDFFHAFQAIRRVLEPQGLMPRCFAASRNCYPSGMGIDMGQGELVYKLTIGAPGQIQDLVWLFDTSDEVVPATVEEQESFYHEWWSYFDRREP